MSVNLSHDKYMGRCIALGRLGLGNVAPNPMVGCVIVFENQIIGEGFHTKHGNNHAEVEAIQHVLQRFDETILSKSTLYVNLEPCSHFGKTPPCVDLILKYKIPRVVIGNIDLNPKIKGQSIQKLKDYGTEVTTEVLENKCYQLNKRFFTFHTLKRPYVILKWAQTKDGFISRKTIDLPTKNNWISSDLSRKLVHKWRSEEQAILVGANTVKTDNPELSTRFWTGKHPLRVVIDRYGTLNRNFAVFNNVAETIVFSEINKDDNIVINFNDSIGNQILHHLYKLSITSIIIEGGTKTLNCFLQEHIWDEARVFTGNTCYYEGIKATEIKGKLQYNLKISTDQLSIFQNVFH